MDPWHRSRFAACSFLFSCLLGVVSCQGGLTAPDPAKTEADFQALLARYPGVDLERGREVYQRHCSVCHQVDGRGTGKAIPALVKHLPTVLRAQGGRRYLTSLVLYGVSGKIVANEQTYLNMMPSLGGVLKDEAICAALNYAALSWGNDAHLHGKQLISLDDVAQSRAQLRTPAENLALRSTLVLAPEL